MGFVRGVSSLSSEGINTALGTASSTSSCKSSAPAPSTLTAISGSAVFVSVIFSDSSTALAISKSTTICSSSAPPSASVSTDCSGSACSTILVSLLAISVSSLSSIVIPKFS